MQYFNLKLEEAKVRIFVQCNNGDIQSTALELAYNSMWYAPSMGTQYILIESDYLSQDFVDNSILGGLNNDWQALSQFLKRTIDEFFKKDNSKFTSFIKKLKEEYPEVPDSLIELLKNVDGTYFRKYKGETVVFYFLGSDVEEYPYYLLSSSQILESKDDAYKYYADYVDRKYEEVEIDEEIISDSKKMRWLHFSDCMNNGGTSQLFIDFSPSEKGVKGQIIRYLHDPDEIAVIADSFDEYLEELMEYELDFINEDTME